MKMNKDDLEFDAALDVLLKKEKDLSKIFEENGLFKRMTKRLVEKVLNGEIDHHLGYKKYDHENEKTNYRNGNSTKNIITENGEISIEIPRDRNETFEPKIIPKHQRRFEGFDEKVISLYAKGMTLFDIKLQLSELYGVEISSTLISEITERIMDDVTDWQNLPLDKVYPIVYFNCIRVKVHDDKQIKNKAVYIALGIDTKGFKDILGMWISDNEGAKFWMGNFTDMKNRGLEDILIACSDNLTGFIDALVAVFKNTSHQLCIVHQIGNSLKFVLYKDRKSVATDLKTIYKANNEQAAEFALSEFEKKWTMPQQNWNMAIMHFAIKFEGRLIIE